MYTKGKWEAKKVKITKGWDGTTEWIVQKEPEVIASVKNFVGSAECEANARLIAAAPLLLTALEGLLKYHYHNDMGVKPKEYHEAKAAIAEAEKGRI